VILCMVPFLLRKPMRGKDDRAEILFSYIRLDERIPADHPLRVIRQLVDAALAELSRAFAKALCPGLPTFYPAGTVLPAHLGYGRSRMRTGPSVDATFWPPLETHPGHKATQISALRARRLIVVQGLST